MQGLIAHKTRQAQEEIALKSKERKNNNTKKNSIREKEKKRASDTTESAEQELQRETSNLIENMKSAGDREGLSDFGKAVLEVLNNYQTAINTIRSMAKNMYDGLFFLTNDARGLEQNQTVIMTRLDRLDSKASVYLISYSKLIFFPKLHTFFKIASRRKTKS